MKIVKIDERTAKGKKLIEFLEHLDFVTVEDAGEGASLDKAIEDVKKGRVKKVKDLDRFFSSMKKNVTCSPTGS